MSEGNTQLLHYLKGPSKVWPVFTKYTIGIFHIKVSFWNRRGRRDISAASSSKHTSISYSGSFFKCERANGHDATAPESNEGIASFVSAAREERINAAKKWLSTFATSGACSPVTCPSQVRTKSGNDETGAVQVDMTSRPREGAAIGAQVTRKWLRRLDLAGASIADSNVVEAPLVARRMVRDHRVSERELLDASGQRTQELLDEAARLVEHVRPARVLVDALVEVAVPVQLDHVTVHVGAAARLHELHHGRAALERRRRLPLGQAGRRRDRRQVHHGQSAVLLGDRQERRHFPLVLLAPVLGAPGGGRRLFPLAAVAARVRRAQAAKDLLVVARREPAKQSQSVSVEFLFLSQKRISPTARLRHSTRHGAAPKI